MAYIDNSLNNFHAMSLGMQALAQANENAMKKQKADDAYGSLFSDYKVNPDGTIVAPDESAIQMHASADSAHGGIGRVAMTPDQIALWNQKKLMQNAANPNPSPIAKLKPVNYWEN